RVHGLQHDFFYYRIREQVTVAIPQISDGVYSVNFGVIETTNNSLRHAFLAHTACDIIDERAAAAAQRSQNAPPQGTAAAAAAAAASGYLGLLQSVGDMSVHGLATATGVKILLLCAAADGSTPKDSDVRAALEFVHGCYAQLVCSPFHSHDEPQLIRSARFDKQLAAIHV
ncbi:hypothetical protein GQ42DRAFT_165281, partial [Ramicandelaber brevisporus]